MIVADLHQHEPPRPPNELVNPSHYSPTGMPPPLERDEPVQVIELLEQCTDWNVAQIIKYVYRYKSKGGLDDLHKAQWHLTRIMDRQRLEENR